MTTPSILLAAPRGVSSANETRYLFIVSRREPSLYQYAVRAFARRPEIQVIYDRRQGERRRAGSQVSPAAVDHLATFRKVA